LYACPFCAVVAGGETESCYTRQRDVIWRDSDVTAFIASHWWPRNHGHVLIVPNAHIENLYAMPDDLLARVHVLSRNVAIAFKETYRCDGVSVRQHNEPAGNQDVWHYHLHVFPRFVGDRLYQSNGEKYLSDPADRVPFAELLREHLAVARRK
jgi:histidine triad (HIT) family protein